MNYRSPFERFKVEKNLGETSVEFHTTYINVMGSGNKGKYAYAKLSQSYKNLCQCILEKNDATIKFVMVFINGIADSVSQKLLDHTGDGEDTFWDYEFVAHSPLYNS